MAGADDDSAPWVALGVYAARTGQHIDKVRAAVRRGRLPGRKGNDGHWLVRLTAAEADLAHDAGTTELVAEPRRRLAEAQDEIAQLGQRQSTGAPQARKRGWLGQRPRASAT